MEGSSGINKKIIFNKKVLLKKEGSPKRRLKTEKGKLCNNYFF